MSDRTLAMMPWFPRDFIAATLGWRLLERALYRGLLDAQWEMESLPDDEEELARIAGATASEFEAAWPRVAPKFPLDDDGRRRNRKLEEHREVALAQREKKRAAGRAGGQASGKRRSTVAEAGLEAESKQRSSNAQAEGQAKSKPPSPSPSPSPTAKKDYGPQAAPADPKSNGHDEFEAQLKQLQAVYPRRSGSQRWPDARKAIRARLGEGHTWAEILEGAERYARWCEATGKTRTETVQQAATFVGRNKGFLEDWEPPTENANGARKPQSARERSQARLRERAEQLKRGHGS